ncbi:hypothetical protein OG206_32360 [Streptomyces sp. NBC_01341]|uniref:hypothetical protein n=1 Tax=Streptomyces sp. NBC_01341 TaxID=2903831 RepID=UPI002E119459|nr:hypothetical protein OG206_32360 [Streptomyces sp. NBC_01341]
MEWAAQDPERAAQRAAQLTAIEPNWSGPWPLNWQRHYRVLADLADTETETDEVVPAIEPGVRFEGDDLWK